LFGVKGLISVPHPKASHLRSIRNSLNGRNWRIQWCTQRARIDCATEGTLWKEAGRARSFFENPGTGSAKRYRRLGVNES
jgi:hypothetical protein